jgi:hypothetical protein
MGWVLSVSIDMGGGGASRSRALSTQTSTGHIMRPQSCFGSVRVCTLARAQTPQIEAPFSSMDSTHAEPNFMDPCRAKMAADSVIFSWTTGSAIFQTPAVIHWQGRQSLHNSSHLAPYPSPQFTLEEAASWSASSAGETFFLDGQPIHPMKKAHSAVCSWAPHETSWMLTAGTSR